MPASNGYRRSYAPSRFAHTPLPAASKKEPVKIEGDGKAWVTIQRVTDPASRWVKTTRAMSVSTGVVINTCSRKQGKDMCTEALVFVPGARIEKAEGINRIV